MVHEVVQSTQKTRAREPEMAKFISLKFYLFFMEFRLLFSVSTRFDLKSESFSRFYLGGELGIIYRMSRTIGRTDKFKGKLAIFQQLH